MALENTNFVLENRIFLNLLGCSKKSKRQKEFFVGEQGIGDTLNWSAGLLQITKQAKHCILECQKKLFLC